MYNLMKNLVLNVYKSCYGLYFPEVYSFHSTSLTLTLNCAMA